MTTPSVFIDSIKSPNILIFDLRPACTNVPAVKFLRLRWSTHHAVVAMDLLHTPYTAPPMRAVQLPPRRFQYNNKSNPARHYYQESRIYLPSIQMSLINVLLNQTIIPNLTTSETYIDFLLPGLNVATLIHNSSFTDSLGCYLDFDRVLCNETCSNMTQVLANWPNFYSCSWYSSLSDLDHSINLTTSEASRLEDLGMFGEQSNGSDTVSLSVANCLADYCQYSAECTSLDIDDYCSLENLLSGNLSGNVLNQGSGFNCMRVGVCSSTSNVNPDIGGLGVRKPLRGHYFAQYLTKLGDTFTDHPVYDIATRSCSAWGI